MFEYDLLMAHPSVCSEKESLSHVMDLLKCQPHNVLRYTTAVDIIAPVFDIDFFQDSVALTLENATYGMPIHSRLQQSAVIAMMLVKLQNPLQQLNVLLDTCILHASTESVGTQGAMHRQHCNNHDICCLLNFHAPSSATACLTALLAVVSYCALSHMLQTVNSTSASLGSCFTILQNMTCSG